jgi:hypothetical protein
MEEATAIARRYEARSVRRRELNLADAKDLKRMEEIDGWRCVGSASAGDFGERRGVAAWEARNQLSLGRAIRAVPAVEEEVRTGRITVPSGALLGQVLPYERLLRDGDDWIGWARSESTRALRRRVQRRKEELAQGSEELKAISLHVTERALEDFHRARKIASGKAREYLTEGQAFATVVDCYLDHNDEDRVKPGKRRMPHTSLVNGRTIPAEVKREVASRSSNGARHGMKCAVPYCDNEIYVQHAHLTPHRLGGARESRDILRLCRQHHVLLDAGYLKFTGTADNPRFTDREGNDLSQRVGGGPDPP